MNFAPIAALMVMVATAAPVVSGSALPFIEDNYPKALAEARARHVPIFVESWARW